MTRGRESSLKPGKTQWITVILLLIAAGMGYYFYKHRVPFDEQKPAVGEAAPQLSLADLSGSMVRLADYRGKVLLINFWASWCPPCKDEMPGFQNVFLAFENKGFAVIGVAINDIDQSITKELHILFPVVAANDRVKRDYGDIAHPPVSFLVGKDGRIVRKVKGNYSEAELKRDVERLLSQPSS